MFIHLTSGQMLVHWRTESSLLLRSWAVEKDACGIVCIYLYAFIFSFTLGEKDKVAEI